MKKSALLALASIASLFALNAHPGYATSSRCESGNLRWASSSDTLSVNGASTTCTPADLYAYHSTQVVRQGPGTYLLRVNLKLAHGARLAVVGTSAGGTTNALRLLSNNTGGSAGTVSITADYGSVLLKNTNVTSWNEAAKRPDTKYSDKRAFIRVRSRYVNNAAQRSRMDVINSNVGYLGYHAAESYGLTWKVMGTKVFDKVDVLGRITGSRIHHNYFGAYTYGAYGMRINNNYFDHNVQYGLDSHDDSDHLDITNNRAYRNGNHGIICSMRCDHLQIRGNRSYNNVGHGIMLHRSADHSVVANNMVTNNAGEGIALFESNNNTVSNNHLSGNKNSLRLSLGSSNNRFLNNRISSSTAHGIYTYKGRGALVRPGNKGINRNNVWVGNIVRRSAGSIVKLAATDRDRFERNDFRGNPGAGFDVRRAKHTKYVGNKTDPGVSLP